MDIVELEGEDRNLYSLVAHLVMNSEVLSYNLNYPFRTSPEFRWFVAMENGSTLGFIPVRVTGAKAVINNYYVAQDEGRVFSALLAGVVRSLGRERDIESVTQTRHIRFFEKSGFSVMHYWKKYARMRACKDDEEERI